MAAASFTSHAPAGVPEETLRPLITTVERFLEVREELAKQRGEGGARGAALLLVHALIAFHTPETRDVGQQMLVLACSEANVQKGEGKGSYKGWALTRSALDAFKRLDDKPYVARSYVAGTSPENNYTLPKECSVTFRLQDKYVGDVEKGDYKVFVWSSGADSARPVTCKRNDNGVWKAHEFSTLTVGIRAPTGPKTTPSASDDL